MFILRIVYKILRQLTSESQLLYQSNDGWYTLCFLHHFAPWNTLGPKSLFLSTQFTPWHNLVLSKLSSSTHFAPQHTLLLSSICSQEHFAPWNTLLLVTLCSMEHFTPWNTLLPVTLFIVVGCKVCLKGKVIKKKNVPGSYVCWEAKCLRSKLGWGVKCSRKQNVLMSKMIWEAKCVSAKWCYPYQVLSFIFFLLILLT